MAKSTVTPVVASEDDASRGGRIPTVVLGFTALIAAAVLATQEDPRSGSGAARIPWVVPQPFRRGSDAGDARWALGRHRRHRVPRARPRNAARLPRHPPRRAADALRRQPTGRLGQRCRVASASLERGRAAPPIGSAGSAAYSDGAGATTAWLVLAGWLILGWCSPASAPVRHTLATRHERAAPAPAGRHSQAHHHPVVERASARQVSMLPWLVSGRRCF